jgi:hypothetical protein
MGVRSILGETTRGILIGTFVCASCIRKSDLFTKKGKNCAPLIGPKRIRFKYYCSRCKGEF